MALELTMRHGTLPPPSPLGVDREMVKTPERKIKYNRQFSDPDMSPLDTPRKNKRKLSEPKRRTTDFSIKRLCPDSPGSACSESGRSEESTPERVSDDSLRDSPTNDVALGLNGDKDMLHSQLRPPYVFPDMRHHPYFIPQFYYNRYPNFPPGSEPNPLAAGYRGLPGLPTHTNNIPTSVPVKQISQTRSSQDSHAGNRKHVGNHKTVKQTSSSPSQTGNSTKRKLQPPPHAPTTPAPSHDDDDEEEDYQDDDSKDNKKNRKNYKNMTRERRVEANARERSRVHTISAAFDGLRRAVPSYSYNQKLSKLAILRIACTYINALSKLTDDDDHPSAAKAPSFAECVDSCTRTIQTEGKARRRH